MYGERGLKRTRKKFNGHRVLQPGFEKGTTLLTQRKVQSMEQNTGSVVRRGLPAEVKEVSR